MPTILARELGKESRGDLSEATLEEINSEINDLSFESMEITYSLEHDQLVLEECLEAAESLESIIESLETAKEQGQSLDSFSAEGYYRAIENAVGTTLTAEIFGQNASLESVTAQPELILNEATLEKAKGVLSRLWSGVKNAGGRVKDSIADGFSKIFQGVDKLEKKSKTLSTAVDQISGEPKKEEIKVAQGSRLHYQGNLEADDVVKGLQDTNEAFRGLNEAFLTLSGAVTDVVQEMIPKAEEIADISDKEERKKKMNQVSTEYNKRVGEMMKEGMDQIKSISDTPISGGRRIIAYKRVSPENVDLLSLSKGEIAKLVPSIVGDTKIGEFDNSQKIQAPSQKQIEDVHEQVEESVKIVKELTENMEKALEKTYKSSAALYQLMDAQGKNKIWSAAVSAVRGAVVLGYLGALNNSFYRTADHEYSVARAGLNYVEKTSKNFK